MRRLFITAIVALLAGSAQAGVGDELNSSLKGLRDLQFTPMEGRIMRCVGLFGDTGFVHTIYFMDGVEEGRSVARLNKGALDTRTMNKVARTYGEWKYTNTEGKIKYFYCTAHGGMWSHYNTVNGYPTWYIYSDKLAQIIRGGKAQAPATFAPDRDL